MTTYAAFKPNSERHKEGESFRKRKRILVLSLLFAFLLASFLIFKVSDASADDSILDISSDDMEEITNLADIQNENLKRIYRLFETSKDTGNGTPSLLYTLMVGAEGENGEEIHSIGRIGREICSLVGMVLVIAYAAIEFLRMTEREDESLETLMKILITAVLGIFMVIYVYDILTAIENIGSAFFQTITEEVDTRMSANGGVYSPETAGTTVTAEGFDALETVVETASDNEDFWSSSSSAIAGFIGSILMYTTFYMIVTSAYSLVFQLILKKIFAPIAIADFVSEGLRSPGARFLKGYFGTYIQMAMFAVIIALGWAALSWAQTYTDAAKEINTRLGAIGVTYCVRFAMKALINASGQTVKEIMGG